MRVWALLSWFWTAARRLFMAGMVLSSLSFLLLFAPDRTTVQILTWLSILGMAWLIWTLLTKGRALCGRILRRGKRDA